ncbi:XkdX family protein [Acetobacterium wieringae]|nr:XkdX family protein [Acetobacterium wieringae]URN83477.1 XkdX family protein [Acetobacterium wieringae]
MLTFEKIKLYFDRGLWTAEMVANAVVKGKITADQYKEITGLDYVTA